MPTAVKQSLFTKLAQVQAELTTLSKDENVNTGKYTYDYISEAAITNALRGALSPLGVAILVSYPRVHTDVGNDIVNVEVEITFADGDSGETFTIIGQGWGTGGDKAGNKAMTSALRMTLCKAFLQAGGDDGEKDAGRPRERPEKAPVGDSGGALPLWRMRLNQAVAKLGSEEAVQRALIDPETGEVPPATALADYTDKEWAAWITKASEPSEVIKARVPAR